VSNLKKAHRKITTDIDIRFRDIDAMGHVNNAVFFTYFEEGRKTFLKTLFNIVHPRDYNFILAHIRCDFFKPITPDDAVSLQMWVDEIGNKRFDLIYCLINPDDEAVVYARGQSRQVCFDYAAQKTIEIPKYFLERISNYMAPP